VCRPLSPLTLIFLFFWSGSRVTTTRFICIMVT
jgi:hypothetical protein